MQADAFLAVSAEWQSRCDGRGGDLEHARVREDGRGGGLGIGAGEDHDVGGDDVDHHDGRRDPEARPTSLGPRSREPPPGRDRRPADASRGRPDLGRGRRAPRPTPGHVREGAPSFCARGPAHPGKHQTASAEQIEVAGVLDLADNRRALSTPGRRAADDPSAGRAGPCELGQLVTQCTQPVHRLLAEVVVLVVDRSSGQREARGHLFERRGLGPADQGHRLRREEELAEDECGCGTDKGVDRRRRRLRSRRSPRSGSRRPRPGR